MRKPASQTKAPQPLMPSAIALAFIAWALVMSILVLCIPGMAFFPGGIAMAMSYACAITIIIVVRNMP